MNHRNKEAKKAPSRRDDKRAGQEVPGGGDQRAFERLTQNSSKMHPGWKEEAKRALDEKELEQCTFAPNIHIRPKPEAKVIELNTRPRAQASKSYESANEEEVQPGAAASRLYKMRKA